MHIPILSICIATYNVEKYILQCLNSIKNKESTINKEIIIVDDKSSDSTIEKIHQRIQENPEIPTTLHSNKNNLGTGGTYNKASQLAKGEYLTFLDSDDFLIAPSFQTKLQLFQKNPDLKIVYGNGLFYEKNQLGLPIQKEARNLLEKPISEIKETLYMTIPMLSISTCIIKHDFFHNIGGFDPNSRSNDRILNIKIFENIQNHSEIAYCEIPCFAYRMHPNNISKDQKKMITLLSQVVQQYFPDKYKKIGYSNIYFFASLNYILQNKFKESYQGIKTSQKYQKSLKRRIVWGSSIIIPTKLIHKLPTNWLIFIKKLIQKMFQ